ncbi:hypothetical protein HPB47_009949 [Ixodes persulcatus]|uniref:Uncharacterized protein n=1 Tax=Ixodes persulcatus TaxID=34615 RepID=A0AC60P143_IXOPE|nr:hypothetical protein HPB47_009949 [Ixodes persulcatus]
MAAHIRQKVHCLHKRQLYLEAESQDNWGHGLDWEPWELQVISDLQQQHNGSDCGMLTAKEEDPPFGRE